MCPDPSRVVRRLNTVLVVLVASQGAALAQLEGVTGDPLAARFVYDDAENFLAAVELIEGGRDPVAAMEERYLSVASGALLDQIESREITAEAMAEVVATHPDAAGAVRDSIRRARELEGEIRSAFVALVDIFPDARFLPVHYMVGPQSGWMGEPSGAGIKIVMSATPFDFSRLPGLVLHETVHVQQALTVGLEEYQQVYGPKKSLLALALREGVATFLTHHILGGPFYKETREYFVAHEEELWRRFDEQKLDREPGDWMWRDPEREEEPRDLGYLLGGAIVQSYYEAAEDKAAAIRRILAIVDAEAFLAESGYPEKFG